MNDKLFLLASVVVDHHHHHYHASILFAPCGTYGLGSIKDHAVCTHPTHLLEKTSLHAVDGYNLICSLFLTVYMYMYTKEVNRLPTSWSSGSSPHCFPHIPCDISMENLTKYTGITTYTVVINCLTPMTYISDCTVAVLKEKISKCMRIYIRWSLFNYDCTETPCCDNLISVKLLVLLVSFVSLLV